MYNIYYSILFFKVAIPNEGVIAPLWAQEPGNVASPAADERYKNYQ